MSPDRRSSVLEALYQTAEYYQEKGDTQSAETQLKQALELSPDHVPSRLLLSKVLVEGGKLDDGLAELVEAYRADKDSARRPLVEGLLAKGARSETEGQQAEALRAYEHVIEVAPDDPAAPKRISGIWRKRAEHAVETDDLDFALQAYTKAGLEDQVERIQELIRQKALENDADAARAHEESEEWEQASARYKKLIEADPSNEKWSQALDRAEVEVSLARCYAEGVSAIERSEWKRASDSFLEVLIVQADYKDAAHRLVQAVEKTTQREEIAVDPSPAAGWSDEGESTSTPPTRARRAPIRLEMTWVLAFATLLSFVAALAVVHFLTTPSALSMALPESGPAMGPSSADSWTVVYEQFLSFLAQDRSVPMAPLAVFVLLLTSGLAGWLSRGLSVEHGMWSERTTDDGRVGEGLAHVGIVQSSLFGQLLREQTPSDWDARPPGPETLPSAPGDALPKNTRKPFQANSAPSNVGEAPPMNGAAPQSESALASLSDTELKETALNLAEEVRSFGQKWKLMAGEAASYPPPKSDDSVQLYVDLIEKLGGFQEEFDTIYRKKVSETCESIQKRLPKTRRTDNDVGQANEADDVEDAARKLEEMAALL